MVCYGTSAHVPSHTPLVSLFAYCVWPGRWRLPRSTCDVQQPSGGDRSVVGALAASVEVARRTGAAAGAPGDRQPAILDSASGPAAPRRWTSPAGSVGSCFRYCRVAIRAAGGQRGAAGPGAWHRVQPVGLWLGQRAPARRPPGRLARAGRGDAAVRPLRAAPRPAAGRDRVAKLAVELAGIIARPGAFDAGCVSVLWTPPPRLRRYCACLGISCRAHLSIVVSTPAAARALRTAFVRAICPLPGLAFSSFVTLVSAISSA